MMNPLLHLTPCLSRRVLSPWIVAVGLGVSGTGSTTPNKLPPNPLPGQQRPDANGHCSSKLQVSINGGCWFKLAADVKDCDEYGYVYKGGCYYPAFPPPRPATVDLLESLDRPFAHSAHELRRCRFSSSAYSARSSANAFATLGRSHRRPT